MFKCIGNQVALLVVILLQVQAFTIHNSFTAHPVSRCDTPLSSLPSHQYKKACSSPLFLSVKNTNDGADDDITPLPTYGGLLGKLTGLSMTAIRKSVRTTTGLSLTAARTTLRGLTGVSVNASLKTLFGIFPPWVSVECWMIIYISCCTCTKLSSHHLIFSHLLCFRALLSFEVSLFPSTVFHHVLHTTNDN